MHIDFKGYIHDKYKLSGAHADIRVKIHKLRNRNCYINEIFYYQVLGFYGYCKKTLQ